MLEDLGFYIIVCIIPGFVIKLLCTVLAYLFANKSTKICQLNVCMKVYDDIICFQIVQF